MPQMLDIRTEKKNKFSVKNLNLHVKDISFYNLFWKKFVIRLVILLIMSSVLLSSVAPLVIEWNDQKINNELSDASLELGNMVSSGMANDRIQTTANVMLSKIYERFENNPFITKSSITAYNMDSGNVIAKSFAIALIESEDVIAQWRNLSNIDDGAPIVHLTQEIKDFCKKYTNDKVRVDKLCFVNSILIPVEVTAINEKGKELESFEKLYSSSAKIIESYQPIWLSVIGNVDGDPVYKAMTTFKYDVGENNVASVTYEDTVDGKITIKSKAFSINNCNYQIDCGYQINFWSGALIYVLLLELVAVLLCALSAFINTRETLSIMR